MRRHASKPMEAEDATLDCRCGGTFTGFTEEMERLCMVSCMADSRFRADKNWFHIYGENVVLPAFNRIGALKILFDGAIPDGTRVCARRRP